MTALAIGKDFSVPFYSFGQATGTVCSFLLSPPLSSSLILLFKAAIHWKGRRPAPCISFLNHQPTNVGVSLQKRKKETKKYVKHLQLPGKWSSLPQAWQASDIVTSDFHHLHRNNVGTHQKNISWTGFFFLTRGILGLKINYKEDWSMPTFDFFPQLLRSVMGNHC